MKQQRSPDSAEGMDSQGDAKYQAFLTVAGLKKMEKRMMGESVRFIPGEAYKKKAEGRNSGVHNARHHKKQERSCLSVWTPLPFS